MGSVLSYIPIKLQLCEHPLASWFHNEGDNMTSISKHPRVKQFLALVFVFSCASAVQGENLVTGGTAKACATTPNAGHADGRHDFDFFNGSWTFHNRKLVGLFKQSHEWEEFDGVAHARPILAGTGSVDEWSLAAYRPGFVGMTIRLFDGATGLWSSYEVSNRSGAMGPAVTGCFNDGIGVLEGNDELEGQAIRVRYVWNVQNKSRPKWEQAFSKDGGKTWESNWYIEFSKAPD